MVSWAKIAKAATISLVLTLLALGGSKLNLFGFEDITNAGSDDVGQRLTAGAYGRDERPGQDLVRIVHIDDEGLTALRGQGWTGWPPGYANLGYMIEDVLSAGSEPPRAVFADLIILGQAGLTPEGEADFATLVDVLSEATRAEAWNGHTACLSDPLTRLACIVEAGGVPIILAKPDAAEQAGQTDVQRRLDQVALLSPVLVGARAYPLVNAYDDQPLPGVAGFDLSPAGALYAAGCLRALKATGENSCGLPAFETAAAAARAALSGVPPPSGAATALRRAWASDMSVVWGDRIPERQAEFTEAVSSSPAPECRHDVGLFTRVFEQSVAARGVGSGERQACAYTFNLGYDRLVAGFGLTQDRYDYVLADRLVLIGSHMRNSDWAPTPLHGQLPGVHYHAMALDNLVQFGADYRRIESTFLNTDDILKSLLTFVLLFTVIVAVMARNAILEEVFPDREGRLPVWATPIYYGLLAVLILGLTGLVTWLGAGVWQRAVVNWLGILSLTFSVLVMAARTTLLQDAGSSLRWTTAIGDRLKFENDTLSRRRAAPADPVPAPAAAAAPAPRRPRSRRKKAPDAS